LRGSGRGEEPSGEKILRLIQIRVATASLEKIWRASQAKTITSIYNTIRAAVSLSPTIDFARALPGSGDALK